MISAFVSKDVEQPTTTLPQNNESKFSERDHRASTPTNQPEESSLPIHDTSPLASDLKKAAPFFDTYLHVSGSGTTSGIPLSQATAKEKNSKQKKSDFWKVFTSLMPEEHTAVKLALRKRRPGYSRTLSSLQVLNHTGGSMKWLRITLKVLSLGILDHKETGDDSEEVSRALLIIVLNTPLDGSQPLPTEPRHLDLYYDSDRSEESSRSSGRRVRVRSRSTPFYGAHNRRATDTVEVRRERSPVRIVREPERVERFIVEGRREARRTRDDSIGSDEFVGIEEHGGKRSRREDRLPLFNLERTEVGEASGPVPGGSSRVKTGRDDVGKTRRELEAYKLVKTREDYELEKTRKEVEGENKDNLEKGKWNAVHDQSEKHEDTGMHLELEDSEEESGMDQEPANKVIEGLFGEWKPGKGAKTNMSA
jgi:hypothetical protein